MTALASHVLLVLALGAMTTPPAHAGPPAESLPRRFQPLSSQRGLPPASVTALLQDHHGFVWIGSQAGLSRFDGYEFVTFQHRAGDESSLQDNWISSLYQDEAGILWVGTNSGSLARFDPNTARFVSYRAPSGTLGEDLRTIHARDGKLWLGSSRGLACFDPKTGEFESFAATVPELSRVAINAISDDGNEGLWLGTDQGLRHFSPSKPGLIPLPSGRPPPDGGAEVLSLLRESSGRLWIGTTDHGLLRYEPDHDESRLFRHDPGDAGSLSGNTITALAADEEDILWIGTMQGGLNRLNRATGRAEHYRNDQEDPNSLSENRISALLIDQGGTLWVSTWNRGVNLLDRFSPGFYTYRARPGRPASLSSDQIYSVSRDRTGALWLGTIGGGLNRLDPSTSRVRTYRHDPQDPDSLSSDVVRATYVDRSGTVWAGTQQGLDRLNQDGRGFHHVARDRKRPGNLGNSAIRNMLEDSRGRFWVGTEHNGLYLLDRTSGKSTPFRHRPQDPTSLASDDLRVIKEDRAGLLWIGHAGRGLDSLDPATGSVVHYRHDDADPGSLSNDRVTTIYEDPAGTLWIGTGGGLAQMIEATPGGRRRFRTFTTADGLAADPIGAIYADESGALWISTIAGISRLDPVDRTFRNFTLHDGAQSAYYVNSMAPSASGERLYFGGPSGLTAFDPLAIRANPIPPPVAITNLLLLNKPVSPGTAPLTQAIFNNPTLTLTYDQQVVSFEFAALHFADPERNQYAYRLEGFDREWQTTNAGRRFATYTNLPAGDYRFLVKAANKDGVWNEEGSMLSLRVLPPPWRTLWAYGAYVLVFAMVAGRIHVSRRQKLLAARRFHEAIRASEERLKLALWGSGDGLWDWNLSTGHVHRAGLGFLGYEDGDIEPTPEGWARLIHPDDIGFVRARLDAHLAGREPDYEAEFRIRTKDDRWIWVLERGKVVEKDSTSGAPTRLVGTYTDRQERKDAEQAILHLAKYDVLTGLPNRALFQERLQEALSQARRHNHRLGLLFIDLDRFKQINDSMGHAIGDALLKQVAVRLRSVLREGDLVARLGGDEFTVILPQVQSENTVAAIAGKLIGLFTEPLLIEHRELSSTSSVGISMFPEDGEDAATLVQHADTAMYYAKERGRSNYQFYTEAMNASVVRRMLLENGLRKAIERNEMSMVYQPRLASDGTTVVGAEALLRWHSPVHGAVAPAEFIPVAEDAGLIQVLDQWALETACRQYALWRKDGIPPFIVSVNLSARSLTSDELPQRLGAILSAIGMPAAQLELEMTETVLMRNAEAAATRLQQLRAMGFALAVDDFGTGYSSLNYLKRFPITTLKIDRSFVKDMNHDAEDCTIVNAIIAMAHALRHIVVAEGVDDGAQVDLLRQQGCDQFQGYYFSRPLTAAVFAQFMRNRAVVARA